MMSQSTTSGTSSRKHIRDHDVRINTHLPHCGDSESETKEALRQRELEEARARATQMEKTMRWWSDCTANWREKWSKVRNERNKAREEARLLRTKLEIAVKDANSYKHESQDLETQNEQLRKEMEKIHMILLKHAGQFDKQIVNIFESDSQIRNSLGIDDLLELYNNVDKCDKKFEGINYNLTNQKSPREEEPIRESTKRDIEEYVLQRALPKHAVELYKEGSMSSLEKDISQLIETSNEIHDKLDSKPSGSNEDPMKLRMAILNLGIEEATKTLSAEKNHEMFSNETEKLQQEINQLRIHCNELQVSRSEVLKQLTESKEQYHIEIMATQADLLDEVANREGMDQRMNELRAELERLQLENATEWGKRERLATEKISLERENKQLKNELQELQERLELRRTQSSTTINTDIKQLNQDLLDIKHANSKLKKVLAERITELTHALRRSEQYETEVKRVRARVDELKKELALAQDEVDIATTTVRRLQRTNEDLNEQLESANIQIEHLKNHSKPYTSDVTEILEDKSQDDSVIHSSVNFDNKISS